MATCKECLHYDACAVFAGEMRDRDEYCISENWQDEWVERCRPFKHKTKYVEQKHGRWNIILSDYDDCELMKCSCCGDEFYDGDNDTVDSLHNYCPNCGAKMDGDTQ